MVRRGLNVAESDEDRSRITSGYLHRRLLTSRKSLAHLTNSDV